MKIHCAIVAIVVLALVSCSPAPQVLGTTTEKIDVMADPVQKETPSTPFTLTRGDYSFTISPQVSYDISAEVKSVCTYGSDWNSSLSPIDFALAWGGLTEDKTRGHIKYSQSNRWYYYEYGAESPYEKNYIKDHSANHHILPATENLKRAVLSVKKGQRIRLKGSLVFVDGKSGGGQTVWWRSSLTRTDEGDGACEVLWVTEMQRDGNVYR